MLKSFEIGNTLTSCMSTAQLENSFTCWSILVNQLKRLLDSKFLRWSLGANQLWCPKSGPTDLTVLTIGSAPSKQWRSAPEAFRAGHYKDLKETGNRARKVSTVNIFRLFRSNQKKKLLAGGLPIVH